MSAVFLPKCFDAIRFLDWEEQVIQECLFPKIPAGADVKGRRDPLPIGPQLGAARPCVYALSSAQTVHKSTPSAGTAHTGAEKTTKKDASGLKSAIDLLCAVGRELRKWGKSDMFVGVYTSYGQVYETTQQTDKRTTKRQL